jgi:hypothetical protein
MVKPSIFECKAKVYVVEGRNKDTGYFDMSIKVPFSEADERTLCDYFFAKNPQIEHSASQATIAEWYNKQGIFFRRKYW